MTYIELRERVLQAKHLKSFKQLQGTQRRITFYIFSEIVENIEQHKFFEPHSTTWTRRRELFKFNISNYYVQINTLYKYNAQRINCIKLEKGEEEHALFTIKNAAEAVGLKVEITDRFDKWYTIFLD